MYRFYYSERLLLVLPAFLFFTPPSNTEKMVEWKVIEKHGNTQ